MEKTSAGLKLSNILPVGGRLKFFGLEANGRESESGSLVWAGVPTPIQARSIPEQSVSADNVSASSNVNCELLRSVKANTMNEMFYSSRKRCIRLIKPGKEGFSSRAFLVQKIAGGFVS